MLSHKIESLGDDGVGSGVGVDVAVAVGGVEDDPFSAEQAARVNDSTNTVDNNFFMENSELRLILIRRTSLRVSLVSLQIPIGQ